MTTDQKAEGEERITFGEAKIVRTASKIFLRIEQLIYVALGTILALTAILALAGTAALLLTGLQDWTGTAAIIAVMDRLLFVLMLIEILYTVRASLKAGALTAEPFLLVGLIACIRRILVISLETSDLAQQNKWSPERAQHFQSSMIELAVLAFLIIVMVGAIFFLRRQRTA